MYSCDRRKENWKITSARIYIKLQHVNDTFPICFHKAFQETVLPIKPSGPVIFSKYPKIKHVHVQVTKPCETLVRLDQRMKTVWMSQKTQSAAVSVYISRLFAFLQADLLTCHGGRSTGVTNNTNDGSVLFKCSSERDLKSKQLHGIQPSFLLHTCAFPALVNSDP